MQNFVTGLFSMFAALLIVLVLAWFVLRTLKRTQYGKSSGDILHFLRALPVGTRERVVLIRYRDKEYMLGVTPGGISLLDKNPVAAEPSDTSPTNSLTHQTDGASDNS